MLATNKVQDANTLPAELLPLAVLQQPCPEAFFAVRASDALCIACARVQGAASAARQQARALAAVRCGYQRAALSARFLSDMAVASLAEDRFGVLQLGEPSLGDVLLCLLGTLGAAQHFSRQAGGGAGRAALGPWRATGDAAYGRRQGDAPVHALRDVLTQCVYNVVGAFGPGAGKAIKEAKAAPPYGSVADSQRLLQSFLDGEQ
jgi:hypothetical protein